MTASNYCKFSHGGRTHYFFAATDEDMEAQLGRARAAARSASWTKPPDVVVFRATYKTRYEKHVICAPMCTHPCAFAGETVRFAA